ncbi:MAG: hypothetical protein PHN38_07300 [Sulfurospirillaceae bacterium]|nr:hypothetical protein [Sulfurospirillaceae bacterium]MDD3462956.1 hypothetical protein [Sulfurospirillaceae bacterium]
MSGKDELLEDYDSENTKEVNLDFKFLVAVYMFIFVGLLVLLPKVYIKNQIYYISRDISKLYGEYSMLKEENRHLKQNVESMRFKNQILDTIFIE